MSLLLREQMNDKAYPERPINDRPGPQPLRTPEVIRLLFCLLLLPDWFGMACLSAETL